MGIKYKYEFTIAIVAFITAFAGFVGYSTLKNIENEVKIEFTGKLDSVKHSIDTVNYFLNSAQVSVNDLQ